MAETYVAGNPPVEYDPAWLWQELQRVSIALAELETPQVILVASHSAPKKVTDGMVVFADGTNWNPGSGAGLYERVGGAWNKL